MQEVIEVASRRKNLTATGSVDKLRSLLGVLIGPYSAGATMKVEDAGGVLLNTFTVTQAAGTFIPIPLMVSGPVTVTIVGTLDCTVFYS